MFFTYVWRELRRRMRQAISIAVGLALGIAQRLGTMRNGGLPVKQAV